MMKPSKWIITVEQGTKSIDNLFVSVTRNGEVITSNDLSKPPFISRPPTWCQRLRGLTHTMLLKEAIVKARAWILREHAIEKAAIELEAQKIKDAREQKKAIANLKEQGGWIGEFHP